VGRPAGAVHARGATRADEVARRQDPPSPGAARRPLPARERRFFVASLETAGSFLSVRLAEQTPLRPFGGGEGEGEVGAQPSHCDAPRRPYMPCVQPRALHPRTWHREGPTRCRGGFRTRPYNAPRHPWCKRADARPRASDHLQGTAVPCPYATRNRAWFRQSCILPARNVGATGWVARRAM
jgi:hypothetical protein